MGWGRGWAGPGPRPKRALFVLMVSFLHVFFLLFCFFFSLFPLFPCSVCFMYPIVVSCYWCCFICLFFSNFDARCLFRISFVFFCSCVILQLGVLFFYDFVFMSFLFSLFNTHIYIYIYIYSDLRPRFRPDPAMATTCQEYVSSHWAPTHRAQGRNVPFRGTPHSDIQHVLI